MKAPLVWVPSRDDQKPIVARSGRYIRIAHVLFSISKWAWRDMVAEVIPRGALGM